MKKLLFLFLISLTGNSVFAQDLFGPLSGVIQSGQYNVIGDISVEFRDSLIIEPGVILNFNHGIRFDVNGYLYAVGNELDSIIFQKNQGTDNWKGIYFYDSASDSNRLRYCIVKDAFVELYGDHGGGISVNSTMLTILNSTITGNETIGTDGGGIYVVNGRLTAMDCCIDNNLAGYGGDGGGIYANSSNLIFVNSSIINNAVEEGFSCAGGVFCENSSLTFTNCDISNNRGIHSWSNYGGGGFYSEECSLEFIDCTFEGNTAAEGAGIYSRSDILHISNCIFDHNIASPIGSSYPAGGAIKIDYSIVTIENSTFSWNEAEHGGAICDRSNSLTMRGCLINNNTGTKGGGLYNSYHSTILIDNCTFLENFASEEGGGGAYFYNGGSGTSEVTIQNSNFFNNYGDTGGGALKCVATQLILSNCLLIENRGGEGAGINVKIDREIVISDCIISGGYCSKGGGIFVEWGGPWTDPHTVLIRNTLVKENSASQGGGGIYCEDGMTVLENCTIVDNECPQYGSGLYTSLYNEYFKSVNTVFSGNTGAASVYFHGFIDSISITYNDFFGSPYPDFDGDIPAGLGILSTVNMNGDSCDIFSNIYLDPEFYSTSGDSAFYLTEDSPCIDAGDPNSPLDPDTTFADIGAYYFDQNAPPQIEDLTITIIESDVVLTWNEIPDAETYRVYRSNVPVFSVSVQNLIAVISEPLFIDYDATANDKYYYRVTYTFSP